MSVTCAGFGAGDFDFCDGSNINGTHTLSKISDTQYTLANVGGCVTVNLQNAGSGWFINTTDGSQSYSTGNQANTTCASIPTGSYGTFGGLGATGTVN